MIKSNNKISNINNYINLTAKNAQLDNLIKQLEYRNRIKKQILQTGGAKIQLEQIDSLVKKFSSIDKRKLTEKITNLNKSIKNLNSLVEKVNLGADYSEINIDKIINDSATFITKINASGQVIKENVKMKLPNFASSDEYKKINEENITTLNKVISIYTDYYSDLMKQNLFELADEKLTEIAVARDSLQKLYSDISLDLSNIKSMGKYNALTEINFTDIGSGDSNVKLPDGDLNKVFMEGNDIPFLQVFGSKLTREQQSSFDKLVSSRDILKIKVYLNSILNLGLCVGDVERRVFNSFLKEELISVPDYDSVKTSTKEILIPTDIFKLTGGNPTLLELNEVINDLKKLKAKCEIYEKKIIESVRNYNYSSLKMMYHNIFMIGIFNNVFVLDNYMEYTHLNGGLVNFYFNIVSNIQEKLSKGYVSKELMYFKKYHSLNLEILYKVLLKMQQIYNDGHTYLKHYVNIKLSGENIRYGCLILNFLKSQLVNYYQSSEASITIYARINDWGTIPTVKLFTRIGTNILNVNPSACGLEVGEANLPSYLGKIIQAKRVDCVSKTICSPTAETQYKFNAVYDEHQTNDTLSTFMGLKLNISKAINTGLITYGYSGTGKTYTLFGSSSGKTSGLLQDALKVDGVSEVSFRIYELYGLGFQYPYYWENTTNIYHNIYHYDIQISGNNFIIKEVLEIPSQEFSAYTELSSDSNTDITLSNGSTKNISFVKISPENLQEVMSNFELLVTAIDNERKIKKRIRETPNNPESSRSLIVYDFVLSVKNGDSDKSTNFLIIDLPGKESIEKTYIDKYYNLFKYYSESRLINEKFQTYGLKTENYPEYIKMLLLATSLQPLLIPVIDPDGFIQGVNQSIVKYGSEAIGSLIVLANEYSINVENTKVSEVLDASIGDKKLQIRIKSGKALLTQSHNINFSIPNYGIFFINALIRSNKFEILSEIIECVIKKRINDVIDDINKSSSTEQLMEQFEKVKPNIRNKITSRVGTVEFDTEINKLFKNINIKKYLELQKNPNLTKEILLNIIKYDYYLTPYEGLYINENIVGIIKYCEGRKGSAISVQRQNTDLNFDNQRDIVRGLILNKTITGDTPKKVNDKLHLTYDSGAQVYSKCLTGGTTCVSDKVVIINPITKSVESYSLDLDSINTMYTTFLNFYEPDNIYNYDKPIIETILSHYLEIKSGQTQPRISDFKIFYLVSNNSLELKCTSQENLLHLTRQFINNISKND